MVITAVCGGGYLQHIRKRCGYSQFAQCFAVGSVRSFLNEGRERGFGLLCGPWI